MLRAFGLFGLLLNLLACAGVQEGYVSLPTPEGQVETTPHGNAIYLEGLTLVLRPHNFLVT